MRKHRVFVTSFAMLFALSVIGVAQAWAQNGVISFWEVCSDRAYVMHGAVESASIQLTVRTDTTYGCHASPVEAAAIGTRRIQSSIIDDAASTLPASTMSARKSK